MGYITTGIYNEGMKWFISVNIAMGDTNEAYYIRLMINGKKKNVK
jgi:hypothetical protein